MFILSCLYIQTDPPAIPEIKEEIQEEIEEEKKPETGGQIWQSNGQNYYSSTPPPLPTSRKDGNKKNNDYKTDPTGFDYNNNRFDLLAISHNIYLYIKIYIHL